jgi:hypothetical protein
LFRGRVAPRDKPLSAGGRCGSIRKRRPNCSLFLDLFILGALRSDLIEVRILRELGATSRLREFTCLTSKQDHNKSQGELRYPAFRPVPYGEMLAFVPFDEHVCRLDKGP